MHANACTVAHHKTPMSSPRRSHARVPLLLVHIFHFNTLLVCDDGDKTAMTEMSGGGVKIEQEIMYFN